MGNQISLRCDARELFEADEYTAPKLTLQVLQHPTELCGTFHRAKNADDNDDDVPFLYVFGDDVTCALADSLSAFVKDVNKLANNYGAAKIELHLVLDTSVTQDAITAAACSLANIINQNKAIRDAVPRVVEQIVYTLSSVNASCGGRLALTSIDLARNNLGDSGLSMVVNGLLAAYQSIANEFKSQQSTPASNHIALQRLNLDGNGLSIVGVSKVLRAVMQTYLDTQHPQQGSKMLLEKLQKVTLRGNSGISATRSTEAAAKRVASSYQQQAACAGVEIAIEGEMEVRAAPRASQIPNSHHPQATPTLSAVIDDEDDEIVYREQSEHLGDEVRYAEQLNGMAEREAAEEEINMSAIVGTPTAATAPGGGGFGGLPAPPPQSFTPSNAVPELSVVAEEEGASAEQAQQQQPSAAPPTNTFFGGSTVLVDDRHNQPSRLADEEGEVSPQPRPTFDQHQRSSEHIPAALEEESEENHNLHQEPPQRNSIFLDPIGGMEEDNNQMEDYHHNHHQHDRRPIYIEEEDDDDREFTGGRPMHQAGSPQGSRFGNNNREASRHHDEEEMNPLAAPAPHRAVSADRNQRNVSRSAVAPSVQREAVTAAPVHMLSATLEEEHQRTFNVCFNELTERLSTSRLTASELLAMLPNAQVQGAKTVVGNTLGGPMERGDTKRVMESLARQQLALETRLKELKRRAMFLFRITTAAESAYSQTSTLQFCDPNASNFTKMIDIYIESTLVPSAADRGTHKPIVDGLRQVLRQHAKNAALPFQASGQGHTHYENSLQHQTVVFGHMQFLKCILDAHNAMEQQSEVQSEAISMMLSTAKQKLHVMYRNAKALQRTKEAAQAKDELRRKKMEEKRAREREEQDALIARRKGEAAAARTRTNNANANVASKVKIQIMQAKAAAEEKQRLDAERRQREAEAKRQYEEQRNNHKHAPHSNGVKALAGRGMGAVAAATNTMGDDSFINEYNAQTRTSERFTTANNTTTTAGGKPPMTQRTAPKTNGAGPLRMYGKNTLHSNASQSPAATSFALEGDSVVFNATDQRSLAVSEAPTRGGRSMSKGFSGDSMMLMASADAMIANSKSWMDRLPKPPGATEPMTAPPTLVNPHNRQESVAAEEEGQQQDHMADTVAYNENAEANLAAPLTQDDIVVVDEAAQEQQQKAARAAEQQVVVAPECDLVQVQAAAELRSTSTRSNNPEAMQHLKDHFEQVCRERDELKNKLHQKRTDSPSGGRRRLRRFSGGSNVGSKRSGGASPLSTPKSPGKAKRNSQKHYSYNENCNSNLTLQDEEPRRLADEDEDHFITKRGRSQDAVSVHGHTDATTVPMNDVYRHHHQQFIASAATSRSSSVANSLYNDDGGDFFDCTEEEEGPVASSGNGLPLPPRPTPQPKKSTYSPRQQQQRAQQNYVKPQAQQPQQQQQHYTAPPAFEASPPRGNVIGAFDDSGDDEDEFGTLRAPLPRPQSVLPMPTGRPSGANTPTAQHPVSSGHVETGPNGLPLPPEPSSIIMSECDVPTAGSSSQHNSCSSYYSGGNSSSSFQEPPASSSFNHTAFSDGLPAPPRGSTASMDADCSATAAGNSNSRNSSHGLPPPPPAEWSRSSSTMSSSTTGKMKMQPPPRRGLEPFVAAANTTTSSSASSVNISQATLRKLKDMDTTDFNNTTTFHDDLQRALDSRQSDVQRRAAEKMQTLRKECEAIERDDDDDDGLDEVNRFFAADAQAVPAQEERESVDAPLNATSRYFGGKANTNTQQPRRGLQSFDKENTSSGFNEDRKKSVSIAAPNGQHRDASLPFVERPKLQPVMYNTSGNNNGASAVRFIGDDTNQSASQQDPAAAAAATHYYTISTDKPQQRHVESVAADCEEDEYYV